MGAFIEIFDDNKKRYVSMPVQQVYSSDISDFELKKIELALIRFADITCDNV